MPGNLSSIALAEEEALATEGYTAQNERNAMFYTYIIHSIAHPDQRYRSYRWFTAAFGKT